MDVTRYMPSLHHMPPPPPLPLCKIVPPCEHVHAVTHAMHTRHSLSRTPTQRATQRAHTHKDTRNGNILERFTLAL